jgi:hypothetical protein
LLVPPAAGISAARQARVFCSLPVMATLVPARTAIDAGSSPATTPSAFSGGTT